MRTDDQSVNEVWRLAERALVSGDAETLDRLLRDHGQHLRAGRVQSTWWGGLAPNYSHGDARSIIAREHRFESWDDFAAHAAALKDSDSPVTSFENAVDAAVTGDVATIERLLRRNPDLIRARSARQHHSTLLHYVGANGVEGFRQRTPANVVRVAEILLDAGADIHAMADIYGGSDTLGLAATSIHPVKAGVLEELIEFLLLRGATAPWSRLINACHANGRRAAAEILASRADRLDLEAAAGLGRLEIVKGFFNPDGTLASDATPEQLKNGFAWACEYGRTEVVDFLLQRGMDVRTPLPHDGQTGLHWAAYGGHPDTVALLLRRGAAVDARDHTYGGTALGWTLYAWSGGDGGLLAGSSRHYDVVRLLVDAGATVEQEWLTYEDARMRALLEKGQ